MSSKEWRTAWTAAQLGPYPEGSVAVQTDLSQVFPDPEKGAVDQSFRLVMRPDIWGEQLRVRFTNLWGCRPVTIDCVFSGLHQSSSAVLPNTSMPLFFNGTNRVTIPPGEAVWSDGIVLPFFKRYGEEILAGRKLAVSFHVVGESGPMTWHSSAMNSSYVSWPGAGSPGGEAGEFFFPFSVNSWFFIDAIDMLVDPGVMVVVCFGDSITDGSNSTLNGEDRWPDIFARVLHAKLGNRISVVNAGIGGNQVAGPSTHTAETPYMGGPAAIHRFERDILSLSGVGAVIWLEGINDFHIHERSADAVATAMVMVVGRLKELRPGIRVVGATLPSAFGATLPAYGGRLQDQKRRALNEFIRQGGLFDMYMDFDTGLTDPATGKLRSEFVPNSTRGGEGDGLHPNRLGKLRMVEVMDVDRIAELLINK